MTRPLPFTFEQFKAIYSQVTRLCVEVVIYDKQKGFLLTLRKKNGYINQWHLAGGTVYFQEKLTDTVQRVAHEELGTSVIILKSLGYIEYFREVEERGFGYSVSLAFLCELPSGAIITLDDQAEKYDFFKTFPDNTIAEHKEFLSRLVI